MSNIPTERTPSFWERWFRPRTTAAPSEPTMAEQVTAIQTGIQVLMGILNQVRQRLTDIEFVARRPISVVLECARTLGVEEQRRVIERTNLWLEGFGPTGRSDSGVLLLPEGVRLAAVIDMRSGAAQEVRVNEANQVRVQAGEFQGTLDVHEVMIDRDNNQNTATVRGRLENEPATVPVSELINRAWVVPSADASGRTYFTGHGPIPDPAPEGRQLR